MTAHPLREQQMNVKVVADKRSKFGDERLMIPKIPYSA